MHNRAKVRQVLEVQFERPERPASAEHLAWTCWGYYRF
jgi:hypothetical protein